MKFGPRLPERGIDKTGLFYFNIHGSFNKKDVKLVGIVQSREKYLKCMFLNEIHPITGKQEWQEMNSATKWTLWTQKRFESFGMDYWVCFFF